jgi:hypothetical protein
VPVDQPVEMIRRIIKQLANGQSAGPELPKGAVPLMGALVLLGAGGWGTYESIYSGECVRAARSPELLCDLLLLRFALAVKAGECAVIFSRWSGVQKEVVKEVCVCVRVIVCFQAGPATSVTGPALHAPARARRARTSGSHGSSGP